MTQTPINLIADRATTATLTLQRVADDGSTAALNLTGKTVTVYLLNDPDDPIGSALATYVSGGPQVTITDVAGGLVTVIFPAAAITDPGILWYQIHVSGEEHPVALHGPLIITAESGQPEPLGVCTGWTTAEAVNDCCPDYPASAVGLTMIRIASDELWRLSGRRWPGLCTTTIRPCQVKCGCGCHHSPGATYTPYGDGVWRNLGCDGCCPPQVDLGRPDVQTVTSVTIDGATLDAAAYRLDEGRWLVRLRDPDGSQPGWPCTQDLASPVTAADTWTVTFTYGTLPPADGVYYAGVLACELWKGCTGDDSCQLPSRAVSVAREGVTLELDRPGDLFPDGRTGLPDVDRWLASVNPHKLRRRSRIVNPETWNPARRV